MQGFRSRNGHKRSPSSRTERTFVSIILTVVLSCITWPHCRFWVFEHTTTVFVSPHSHTNTIPTLALTVMVRPYSLQMEGDAKPDETNAKCGPSGNYSGNCPTSGCHLLAVWITHAYLSSLGRYEQTPTVQHVRECSRILFILCVFNNHCPSLVLC